MGAAVVVLFGVPGGGKAFLGAFAFVAGLAAFIALTGVVEYWHTSVTTDGRSIAVRTGLRTHSIQRHEIGRVVTFSTARGGSGKVLALVHVDHFRKPIRIYMGSFDEYQQAGVIDDVYPLHGELLWPLPRQLADADRSVSRFADRHPRFLRLVMWNLASLTMLALLGAIVLLTEVGRLLHR